MFELKPLSVGAIPAALAKAERYRLLNEPELAESIALDVLDADPDNPKAVTLLLLSLTDQFGSETATESVERSFELLARLEDEYERAYYEGIIRERQAIARLRAGGPGGGLAAYEWFREAMACYERAEPLRPPDNDDAILRWNTCARMIHTHADVHPADQEEVAPTLGE